MRYYSLMLLLLGCSTTIFAQQLNIVPLEYNTFLSEASANYKIKKNGIDTLDLPFIDDFSNIGPYPDEKLWIGNSVYINNTFAIDAPTIGVATFDGADFTGAPYSNSGQGSADTLLSMPLKLAGKTTGSNVKLSFFYEPKGLGDKPGSNDELFVEFKDVNDNWVQVWSHVDTNGISVVPSFNFVTVSINSNDYFYDGFQFRFRNEATLTGFRDLWHVDYVRVTEGASPSTILEDVAFNQPPKSILKTYTEMPWEHFVGFETDELATQNQMSLNNHFSVTQQVRPAFIKMTGTGFNYSNEVLDFGSQPLNGNIPTGITLIDSIWASAEYDNFEQSLETYTATAPVIFDLEMSISPSNQQGTVAPIVRNDTITRQIVFDDYFSYDDGSAETAVAAGRIGDQFAVRYHANVDDTLKAVQINLPRLSGNITNQRINLKVWVNDLDDTPDYQRNFVRAFYVDSVQSWTTYSLDTNAIFIPAGSDFYVGWQQATTPPNISTSFLIGYDRNSEKGFQHIFQDVGAGWQKLDTLPIQPPLGSIMIRPFLGSGEYISTPTKEIKKDVVDFKLYPNPTRQTLNINLTNNDFENYRYEIYNTTGVLMQTDFLTNQLNVSGLSNGLYIIRLVNTQTNASAVEKFMIVR